MTTPTSTTTASRPGPSLALDHGAHTAGGGRPPAWALADFRDDRHSESDRQAPSTAPTAVIPNGPVSLASPASPSKPPSMSSPQDFTFLKELGCGSWSTVMEAVHLATNKRYAVKILSKIQLIRQKKVKYASVEKDALVRLSGTHPGIIKMHAAFQDDSSLYFVLDLAPNGDLADLVKKYGSLSLRCAQWYTAQIVDAILWVHSKGILHRDMKPENVLLDKDLRPKLTDFGSAYIAPDGNLSPRASTFVGSAAYVAPELLNRSNKTTSNSSDLWAIGCTLYFLIAGIPTFATINDYQSFRKIEALDYTFPEGFYPTAKDLVQKLLVLDPSDRIGVEPKSSPEELRNHPFFSTADDGAEATPIKWDTLWTDPVVQPETGIVRPAPPPSDDEDEGLWDDVVHGFSLINVQSPLHGPPSGDFTSPSPGAPIDVPPDAALCEVVETVHEGEAVPTVPPSRVENGVDTVNDPTLSGYDWSAVLSSEETIRRSATVRASVRKGFLKQLRPCALLLTSRPRILCIALDDKQKLSKPSDIKQSIDIVSQPPAGSPSRNSRRDAVVACRSEGQKLLLETNEKTHAYEFADEKVVAVWAEDISSLIAKP